MIENSSATAMLGLAGMAVLAVSEGDGEGVSAQIPDLSSMLAQLEQRADLRESQLAALEKLQRRAASARTRGTSTRERAGR